MTSRERSVLKKRMLALFWPKKPLRGTSAKMISMHNYGIAKCISELLRTPTDAQQKRGHKYRALPK